MKVQTPVLLESVGRERYGSDHLWSFWAQHLHGHPEHACNEMPLLPSLGALGWRRWEWEHLVDENVAPKLSPFLLQHPDETFLCYACLWSSTFKFCPESFSRCTPGHSGILSWLLLIWTNNGTCFIFIFPPQFKNWDCYLKNDTEKEIMTMFFFLSASTILPISLRYMMTFFMAILVCEPFQVPHGNGRVTALEGDRPGLGS